MRMWKSHTITIIPATGTGLVLDITALHGELAGATIRIIPISITTRGIIRTDGITSDRTIPLTILPIMVTGTPMTTIGTR